MSTAGVGVALVLALLKINTAWINTGFWTAGFTLISLAAAGVFLATFGNRDSRASGDLGVADDSRAADDPRAERRTVRAEFARGILIATLLVLFLRSIFIYPSQFALPKETLFTLDVLYKLIGWLAGLALVALSAFSLYRVVSKMPARLGSGIVVGALAVNMAHQVLTLLQFLLSRGLFSLPHGLFRVFSVLSNNEAVFIYVAIALALVALVVLSVRSFGQKVEGDTPAARRKVRAAVRTQKRWCFVLLACVLISLLSITALKAYGEREVVLSESEPFIYRSSDIVIPLVQVRDGHLHRFSHNTADGVEVRFIVVQKNEVAFGVGLDACEICGNTGYYERGDEIVCKRCDVVMNKQTIGFEGGCNPIPLMYEISGDEMIVRIVDLEAHAHYFE